MLLAERLVLAHIELVAYIIMDYAHPLRVERNITTGEISILNCEAIWKRNIAFDKMDRFVALLESSLHGFGGSLMLPSRPI
jgi:hypothetical protein